MGMLTYGALAGVGGEYLKQSEEKRENEFTLIRDKRLSDLKKSEIKFGADLSAEAAAAQHERESGDFSTRYGEDVYRDGEKVASGRDRPPSKGATTKADEMPIYRANGQPATYEQLYNEWHKMAILSDEFGIRRNPDIPAWEEWVNTQVQDKYKINPNKVQPIDDEAPPPEPEEGFFSSIYSSLFGGDDQEKPKSDRGGMLSEEAPAGKPKKLKSPLSRAAQQDPVQMYDEMMAQFDAIEDGVGEQDIIDTIRAYFGIYDWNPPANALK